MEYSSSSIRYMILLFILFSSHLRCPSSLLTRKYILHSSNLILFDNQMHCASNCIVRDCMYCTELVWKQALYHSFFILYQQRFPLRYGTKVGSVAARRSIPHHTPHHRRQGIFFPSEERPCCHPEESLPRHGIAAPSKFICTYRCAFLTACGRGAIQIDRPSEHGGGGGGWCPTCPPASIHLSLPRHGW